jgi:threonine synthase
MDVGDPSNFQRILALYQNDWAAIKRDIPAFAWTDAETKSAIRTVYSQFGYVLCPHTAVGYLGLEAFGQQSGTKANYIGLATAHPVKFQETVEEAIGANVPIPERLKEVLGKEKLSVPMANDFAVFREFLMQKK